ncbi:MAG: hypothetical protein KDC49_07530 [Saprospiraceae bacterium]|nr:hypothetical protein [Saprospiraceae bacterium]
MKTASTSQSKYTAFGIALCVGLIYMIMYMLRKPFTGSTYEGMQWFGLDYKTTLIIAQVIGYASSKFMGISTIPAMRGDQRIKWLVLLFGTAIFSLCGFWLFPPRWGPFWMLINGLPLGMVWGVVFKYCEGRKLTEVLTIVLASNFIISSGLAKSFSRYLLDKGFDQMQVPFLIALFCLPLLGVLLYGLTKIPEPNAEDIRLRKKRVPMTARDRRIFFNAHKYIIFGFILMYALLSVLRDIRDNFAIEVWSGLVGAKSPAFFTWVELPATIVCLISIGFLYKIKDNNKALSVMTSLMAYCMLFLMASSLIFSLTRSLPMIWMVATGITLFIPYILMNGIVFDRYIAVHDSGGNGGYLMYMCDAFGYAVSVLVLISKNIWSDQVTWENFYVVLCVLFGLGVSVICLWLLAQCKSEKVAPNLSFRPLR